MTLALVGLITTGAVVHSAMIAAPSEAAVAPADGIVNVGMVAGPPPQATSELGRSLSIQASVDAMMESRASQTSQVAKVALAYSNATMAQAGASSMPATGVKLTSHFGARWGRLHAGLDFAGPIGTPLRAVRPATVTFAGQQQGYGNKVELTLADGTVLYYGHMKSISVAVGDRLITGQVVGALGNTGRSTGPHVHFEVHPKGGGPVDPLPWLAQLGSTPLTAAAPVTHAATRPRG